MTKKYSPKPIHSYKSYKISDLCRTYKNQALHPQTIRRWIKKEELKAFLHDGDYYIYGAVFKEFLTKRNQLKKDKRKLEFNQFRCGKCKAKQPPLNNIITKLATGFNDCINAFGICRECDNEMQRPYKKLELDKIKENFEILLDELPILCNSLISTNKTHSNNSQKVIGGESLNTKKTKVIKDKSTNIEPEQLNLFDFIN